MNERLPWHAPLWERIRAAREAGRLPHALLLCGPRGLGKGEFARQLAWGLLCEAPASEPWWPCGTCRACRLNHAGTHPDLRRCEPSDEKAPITVDQVREIARFLSLKPHHGPHHIVIIRPAERMNLNAANSLLKTLEEPQPGALLMLVSERPGALPATVRSRCQRLSFTVPETARALDWLQGRLPGGHDAALLLGLANGAPLAALEIAGQGGLERRSDMLEALRAVAEGGTDPLEVAADWLKFGPRESLYWLYGWLVDMVRLRSSGTPPVLGNPDNRALLATLAAAVPTRELLGLLERVAGALRLVDRQVAPQLLLEDVLLAWASLHRLDVGAAS